MALNITFYIESTFLIKKFHTFPSTGVNPSPTTSINIMHPIPPTINALIAKATYLNNSEPTLQLSQIMNHEGNLNKNIILVGKNISTRSL